VVPAGSMKLVAVSGVYMRLVVECLVHIGNILLVSVSFSRDSCCIWQRNLSVDHSPCALRVLVKAMIIQTNSC
jgi:hypothetical protein